MINDFVIDDRVPRPGDASVWEPTDPSSVQLIACGGEQIGDGDLIAECDNYVGRGGIRHTIMVYRGLFWYQIYEAGTGAWVGTLKVQGDPEHFTEDDGYVCRPWRRHAAITHSVATAAVIEELLGFL